MHNKVYSSLFLITPCIHFRIKLSLFNYLYLIKHVLYDYTY